MRTLVAEDITVVRTSRDWEGFFLQERQGASGHLEIPTGTRQHVIVCYLRSLEIDVQSAGGKRRFTYRVGDTRLVPAGSPIRYRWHGETHLLLLGLEPDYVAGVLGPKSAVATIPPQSAFQTLPGTHVVSELIQLLAGEISRGRAGKLAAEGLVQAIVAHLFVAAKATSPEDEAAPARSVHRAVAYLRSHLTESVSVDDVAAACRMSAAHFARQFKAATGFPPHEYLLRLRVARAQQLLRTQGRRMNIAAIASECGFADQSHLGRVFKRVVGVTPAQFIGR